MSLTKWKEREKEQRRNDIINVAKRLFADKDFDEVSMNEIAKEVGLGKGTLYLYFKNKESLYFAVVLQGIRIWVKMVKEELKKGNSGLERLKLFGNTYKEFSDRYHDHLKMLYSPTSIKKQFDVDKMNSSEEYHEVMELFKELVFIWIDSIQTGRDESEIRPDVDPVEASVLLSVIINGTMNMGNWSKEILQSRGIDEQKFIKDTGDLFLHMLMKN